jgi:primosomal protein N' (replication factor Y)
MQPSRASSTAAPAERIRVLLPLPLAGAYDYAVPEGLGLEPGAFVRVPLGSRQVSGVVWGAGEGGVAEARLRAVSERLAVPPMPLALRRFIDWVAGYTLSPPGAVLRMAMSAPSALEPPRQRTAYALGGHLPGRLTAARRRVIEVLEAGPPRPVGELAAEAAVGEGVVRGLAKAGALIAVPLAAEAPFPLPDPSRPGPQLSPHQAAAATALEGSEAFEFQTTLLEGVTGAGKTEVYLEAVAEALEAGRQVLVLLPEIALTAQWLDRFERRFGAAPAAWHSDLTQAQRRRCWRAVAEGRAPVVVGARSALFLPYPDLGLIVVDEEHDGSFKQDEGVIYNARDMAVVRARLSAIPIVLVSATPSLESVINVERGRYRRLNLPERHGAAGMPEVEAVDMRRTPPERGRWLSPPLKGALEAALGSAEQAMLFLNRRGYAPLTLCRACGHRFECPNCSAWLVEHRFSRRLECHHCGHALARPESCPECGVGASLVACGPGVERVAEEVAEMLPEARIEVMTSDTMAGPHAAAELVRRVEERRVDVLIGTQIMAKGHHFPLLTRVGVVDADLGLAGGDLRAAERTYQLLSQVAGRAGRGERPGKVLLQTYMPEHPVMEALIAGDRERFLEREAENRQARGLPPFGRLAALIVSGADEGAVLDAARALGRAAPRGGGVEVLGPAAAPLRLLRGRHRQRLLLMAGREVNVQKLLRAWLAKSEPPGGVRVQVDVDPYSFL